MLLSKHSNTASWRRSLCAGTKDGLCIWSLVESRVVAGQEACSGCLERLWWSMLGEETRIAMFAEFSRGSAN